MLYALQSHLQNEFVQQRSYSGGECSAFACNILKRCVFDAAIDFDSELYVTDRKTFCMAFIFFANQRNSNSFLGFL